MRDADRASVVTQCLARDTRYGMRYGERCVMRRACSVTAVDSTVDNGATTGVDTGRLTLAQYHTQPYK